MLEFLKDLLVGIAIIIFTMSWMLLVAYLIPLAIIIGGWVAVLLIFFLIWIGIAFILNKVRQCE